jgi:hypothetical protein
MEWTAKVRFPAVARIFLVFITFRQVPRPIQLHIEWAPGVKQPGREADQPPPSSSEVKNGGTILPFPHTTSWHGA